MRLFTAVYPPPEQFAYQALSGVRQPEQGITRTPVELIHLTLVFIGNTGAKQVRGVIESVQRAASGIGPVTLSPQRLATHPPGRGPKTVVVFTDAPPGLLELQRRLARRLTPEPDRVEKVFVPHLTVARFDAAIDAAAFDVPLALDPFEVGEVRLMASRLTARGVAHEVVAAVPLLGRA